MQPTDEQQQQALQSIARLVIPSFGYFFRVQGGIHMINTSERDIGYFPNWQALAEHLGREFMTWCTKTHREISAIAYPEKQVLSVVASAQMDGLETTEPTITSATFAALPEVRFVFSPDADAPLQDADGY